MTLLDVFLVIAIVTLVVLLIFIIFLSIAVYNTYQKVKFLERSLHMTIDSIQEQVANRKNVVQGAVPFVSVVAPLIWTIVKKWRSRKI